MVGNELIILAGYGFTSALFAYYSFDFLAHEEYFMKLAGQMFFSMSLLFILLIANLLYLLILNDTTLAYLSTSVGLIGFTIIYYFLMAGIGLYLLSIVYGILKMVVEVVKQKIGVRKKNVEPKQEGS